jgi:hypothetical protein
MKGVLINISSFRRCCLSVFFFLFFQLIFSLPLSFGQSFDEDTIRQCHTEYMTRLLKDRFPVLPSYASTGTNSSATYYIIPVVVHVIHMGGVGNISDELIKSQINVLNEDYGHYGATNTDPRGTDTKIRFCLAKKDPYGKPTTGINRVFSTYTDLVGEDELLTKSLSTWDPHKYLNFWIVRSINGSSNIQAYSFLPSNSGGPAYVGDGVVVLYKYFGKGGNFSFYYNLGKTCSHESGHYFNLMHTWGRDLPGYGDCNDDDGIKDTPNCSLEYYSSPANKCFHPIQCGNMRMIENFLDYSTDGCLSIFTPGQANKMIAAINQYRQELVSPENLANCGCRHLYDSLNNIIDIQLYPSLVDNDKIFLKVKNNFTAPLTFNIYDAFGRFVFNANYDNVGTETLEINFTSENLHLRPGLYILRGSYSGTFQKKFVVPVP